MCVSCMYNAWSDTVSSVFLYALGSISEHLSTFMSLCHVQYYVLEIASSPILYFVFHCVKTMKMILYYDNFIVSKFVA